MVSTEGRLDAVPRLCWLVHYGCLLLVVEVVACRALGASLGGHEKISFPHCPNGLHVLVEVGVQHLVRAELVLRCLLVVVSHVALQRRRAGLMRLLKVDLSLFEVATLLFSLIPSVNGEADDEENDCHTS